ncbi:MAG TPA: AAA family ATPase [Candidatus Paceibacterota bacterium]|nr:AAA family ATPase [Candidatus Paceibacterota bacterium]HRZ34390.1 AAA family ATPase [Candidatus Paceibacterota bacterium]
MITFAELRNKADAVYPAVLLDRYTDYRLRKIIRAIFLIISLVLFALVIVSTDSSKNLLSLPPAYVSWSIGHAYLIRGLLFIFFPLWVFQYLFEAFYLSYYFDEKDIDFDVARLTFLSDDRDLTKSFLNSEIGRRAMFRLQIGQKQVKDFFVSDRKNLRETNFRMPADYYGGFISLIDYGQTIYEQDESFTRFLAQNGVTKQLFLGALAWVDDEDWRYRNDWRWWIRSNLARIPSLGRNWAFGKTYLLEKFGNSIMAEPVYRSLGDKWRIHREEISQVENILVRDTGANVMLISPTSEAGLEVVASFGKMIFNGQTLPDLEDKRIFVLDVNLLITQASDRQAFEENIISILAQANSAGNVILVLPQISAFLENANKIGVDVSSLLSEVLESKNIQIIGISDKKSFHEVIETDFDLMQFFEKVSIKEINYDLGVQILQEESGFLESKYKVFFTYQSLVAIAEGAEKYFMATTYSDKILDLLHEVAIKSRAEKKIVISADDVYKVLSIKTGVVQGTLSSDEKQKLSSLEEILHKRVIGQNEAIQFVADALRRGRLGISNPKRPIGSFLFLGPTGVGKTETTKALAESFFGSEKNILRFDMSEFTGADAVERLIGSAHGRKTGALAEKIINDPYGVLLLDEFEKTTKEVLDLFLQILDEGQFTDSRGQKIIARNLIIIATSNAGSDLIYKASLEKKDLGTLKEKILNTLIAERIFKPELLNRFDGVVLFHALNEKHLYQIAKLMLRKLDERLTDKGVKLNINEDLLNYLVKVGNDPKFGARAMNRAIQNDIEKMIADRLISEKIKAGSYLTFKYDATGKLQIAVSDKIV